MCLVEFLVEPLRDVNAVFIVLKMKGILIISLKSSSIHNIFPVNGLNW